MRLQRRIQVQARSAPSLTSAVRSIARLKKVSAAESSLREIQTDLERGEADNNTQRKEDEGLKKPYDAPNYL